MAVLETMHPFRLNKCMKCGAHFSSGSLRVRPAYCPDCYCELNKISKEQFDTFLDLVHYCKEKNMCTTPYCTTCGCMDYRNLLFVIGPVKLADMIRKVTYAGLAEERGVELDWHNMLEIAIKDFPKLGTVECVAIQEYRWVFYEYHRLRKELHYKIPDARWILYEEMLERFRKKVDVCQ